MNVFTKAWRLLRPAERRSAAVLLGLMAVGMALETLGVGLVIPALALMTSQDLGAVHPAIGSLLEGLGNPTQSQLIVGALLVLLAVYALKGVYLAFVAWRQTRFAFGLQAALSQRLFAGYLQQPWTFHLQHNSAYLIRNVTGEVDAFRAVVQAVLIVLAESLVVVGIGGLLLIVEPVGAVVVISVLGVAAWGFHRLTRGPLIRWGAARQYHDGQRYKHLQEGLHGVKDAKLLGREADVIAQYGKHTTGSARLLGRQGTLDQLPRLWLELLAVTGLVVLVIVMLGQGKPQAELIPTVGLFAAAAFRLLPSLNRVLNGIQGTRFGLPAVESLHRESEAMAENTQPPAPGGAEPLRDRIEIRGVTYSYPDSHIPALSDVTMDIECGTSVGFVGTSGAGKSTLVDVILGLLTPDEGRVLVDGTEIRKGLRSWQDQIGYVPQSIYLSDDTLRRNVAFGVAEDDIDDEAVERAVRAAQLHGFVASLPKGLSSYVGERGVRLSGGQRQRIGIARALYHDPSVLVLDEATSALDTETEREVMKAVNALHGKKTILIVSHRFSTVERCDYLYRLEGGRVLARGSVEEVMSQTGEPLGEPAA